MIKRISYRARQFVRALTAPFGAGNLAEAQRILSPAQWELFLRMPPADRRHALEVYRTLKAEAPRSMDLQVAALLHDVGKAAAPPPLWARVAAVLMEQVVPRTLEQLSQGESEDWRQYFKIYCRHAEIGADWAAQANCTPRTVALIRRHHEPLSSPTDEEERLLALLQRADDNL